MNQYLQTLCLFKSRKWTGIWDDDDDMGTLISWKKLSSQYVAVKTLIFCPHHAVLVQTIDWSVQSLLQL